MDARGSRRPRSRTFRSLVARVVLARVAVFGALALTIALGQAIAVNSSAHPSDHEPAGSASHRPSWQPEYAAEYPGCVSTTVWPAEQIASSLVVYSFRDHARHRMPFATAWGANHNDTEVDDVWVVGVCR